jgi:hypothetical protein
MNILHETKDFQEAQKIAKILGLYFDLKIDLELKNNSNFLSYAFVKSSSGPKVFYRFKKDDSILVDKNEALEKFPNFSADDIPF